MNRPVPWIVAAFSVTAFSACQPEPLENEDLMVETDGFAVSKPKSAPPGSLGGICGKNFVECDTDQKILDKFNDLPRTSVTWKREVEKLTLKFRVPRLVNDHKEKLDQIEIIAVPDFDIEHTYVTYKRNGTVVYSSAASSGSGQIDEPIIDLYKGGWETVMAFNGDHRPDLSLITELKNRINNTEQTLNAPPSTGDIKNTCGWGLGVVHRVCFWCKTQKIGVAIAPWFGATAVIKWAGTAFSSGMRTALVHRRRDAIKHPAV